MIKIISVTFMLPNILASLFILKSLNRSKFYAPGLKVKCNKL